MPWVGFPTTCSWYRIFPMLCPVINCLLTCLLSYPQVKNKGKNNSEEKNQRKSNLTNCSSVYVKKIKWQREMHNWNRCIFNTTRVFGFHNRLAIWKEIDTVYTSWTRNCIKQKFTSLTRKMYVNVCGTEEMKIFDLSETVILNINTFILFLDVFVLLDIWTCLIRFLSLVLYLWVFVQGTLKIEGLLRNCYTYY